MSFDKLAFVKRLEGPDMFSRPQAEALSEAFDQAIRDSVATKDDVLRLETTLRGDMSALRADVHREITDVRLWTVATLASVLAAAFGIIVTLLRH